MPTAYPFNAVRYVVSFEFQTRCGTTVASMIIIAELGGTGLYRDRALL